MKLCLFAISIFFHSILTFQMFIAMSRGQKGSNFRLFFFATLNTIIALYIHRIVDDRLFLLGIFIAVVFFIESNFICQERIIGKLGMGITTVSHIYVFIPIILGYTSFFMKKPFSVILEHEYLVFDIVMLAVLLHALSIGIFFITKKHKTVNKLFANSKLISPLTVLGFLLVIYLLVNTAMFKTDIYSHLLILQQILIPPYILLIYYFILQILIKMLVIDDYKQKNETLEITAHRDGLTGLYNKATSISAIDEYLAIQNEGAFIIVDLDNFKEINDSFGHSYGDSVLISVANHLREIFFEDDIVSRWGGDEFIVYMKQITNKYIVVQRVDRVCQKVHSVHKTKNGKDITLSASIGISMAPSNGINVQELFDNADEAMYELKHSGKNGYLFFSDIS